VAARGGEAYIARFGGAGITHVSLAFDDTGDPEGDFVARLPPNPDAHNTIRVRLSWVSTTAITGAVKWDAQFESGENPHPWDTDGFAAVRAVTTTVNGTVALLNDTSIDFTFSQADNLSAEEMFRLRVIRDTTDAADTMVGIAHLANITLEYITAA
jgi:hypothetical protein